MSTTLRKTRTGTEGRSRSDRQKRIQHIPTNPATLFSMAANFGPDLRADAAEMSLAVADRYVARIFGENNYAVVDHVERLPVAAE